MAYDGKRVDRTLVLRGLRSNPTITEHEALVKLSMKTALLGPLVPAAPAFGECRATMNPLFYSPKAGSPSWARPRRGGGQSSALRVARAGGTG